MEIDILYALEDLGYPEKIDEQSLKVVIKDTGKYSKVLEWICNELKSSIKLEESITHVEKNDDLNSFHMELSSLLKELGCPYDLVMNGNLAERFGSEDQRLLVLNFMLSELQAARISYINNHKQLKVEFAESSTARLLKQMMQVLGISKPPDNIPMSALFTKLNERIVDIRKKMSPQLIDKPFFTGQLSEKQWTQIEQLNQQFQEEYLLRREMLLKRLDVTVQSFHWSDRLKNKKDEINKIFREKRGRLQSKPNVAVSDILAARSDLAILEKTSCSSVRANTKSAVNDVVIGRVPDRGGRPNQIVPPPPEMPPWQQRQGAGHTPATGQQGWSQGPQTQRDYGAGRGPRGGAQRPKVQGGWSGGGGDRGGGHNNYQQQQQQSHSNYGQQNDHYSQQQQPSHYQQQQSYSGGGGGYQQQHHHQQSDRHYQDQGGHRDRRDDGYQSRGGGRGGGGYRGGQRGQRHQY